MPSKATLSRDRQRQTLGDEVFKAQQNEIKRQYRARVKAAAAVAAAAAAAQEEEKKRQEEKKEEIPAERFKRSPVSNTKTQHLQRIRRFYNTLFKTKDEPLWNDDLKFLDDFKKVTKKLVENFTNNNTIGSYLESFAWVLQEANPTLNKKYKALAVEYKDKAKAHVYDNVVGPNEKIVKWTDIKDRYKTAEGANKVFLALIALLPPRRTLDYALLLVNDGSSPMNQDYNYVDLITDSLIYNNYKTKKNYGTQTFKMPEELSAIIRTHIQNAHLKNNDYVIGNFSNPSTIFSRMLGGLNMNSVRHSFISDFLKDNPTVRKRQNIANMIAHRLDTQLHYERRNIE